MFNLFTIHNNHYMVPVVYAVGNHDLGLNNDPNTNYESGKYTPLMI